MKHTLTASTIDGEKDEITISMEPELPNDLKPVDEETLLQSKLDEWNENVRRINKAIDGLKQDLEAATAKVKFYEKAIKSYNKAFKK